MRCNPTFHQTHSSLRRLTGYEKHVTLAASGK
jgi:hypothetical protein